MTCCRRNWKTNLEKKIGIIFLYIKVWKVGKSYVKFDREIALYKFHSDIKRKSSWMWEHPIIFYFHTSTRWKSKKERNRKDSFLENCKVGFFHFIKVEYFLHFSFVYLMSYPYSEKVWKSHNLEGACQITIVCYWPSPFSSNRARIEIRL